MSTAQMQFAATLAKNPTKITIKAFFECYHAEFTLEGGISFREYFLELVGHEDEFIVPHSKLVEFGIMATDRSTAILTKLKAFGLVRGDDYDLPDGESNARSYILTPEAFKLCLLRARRRGQQSIDPTIYARYYLRLERVFKLYTDYERMCSQKLLAIKDAEIDRISSREAPECDVALEYPARTRSIAYSLKTMKMVFVVGLYNVEQIPCLNFYFSCTNFADVDKRAKVLRERHLGMTMLRVETLCLIVHEDGDETLKLAKLNASEFIRDHGHEYMPFTSDSIEKLYGRTVTNARRMSFHNYQTSLDLPSIE